MFTPLYTRIGALSRTQIGTFCVDLTAPRVAPLQCGLISGSRREAPRAMAATVITKPDSWNSDSDCPSTIQPRRAPVTGAARPSSGGAAAGKLADPVEPQHEGGPGRDDAEVGKPADVAHRDVCRRPLDEQGHRQQQAGGDEHLPSGRSESVGRGRESLGQHDPQRERHVGGDREQNADRIESGAGTDHHEADPEDGDGADDKLAEPRASIADCPRQHQNQQRLNPSDSRGDTARKAVQRSDQEREEQTEIADRQHRRVAPLDAARPPGRCDATRHEEQQAGRQHAQRGDEERTTRWQQLGDDDRGRSPSDRGKNRRSESMSLHVHYLKIK